ncbi:putative casein kinase II [Diplonema papillatum]|nr:putative casein kinase II [Diplonema papillatum]
MAPSPAEIANMQTVVRALLSALRSFTGEVPPAASSPDDLPSMNSVAELITLGVGVLQKNRSPEELRALLDADAVGFIEALIEYILAKLDHDPGSLTREAQLRSIVSLRVLVLRSLAKIVALTSFDLVPPAHGSMPGAPGHGCAAIVTDAFVGSHLVEVLGGIAGAPKRVHDDVKVAAAECLFVYALRSASGREHLAGSPDVLQRLVGVLRSGECPMVRNYLAACLRELASTHPAAVAGSGLKKAARDVLLADSSSDVRVLVIESLEVLHKSNPRAGIEGSVGEALAQLLDSHANEHLQLLALSPREDTAMGRNAEVTDATCRFVDSTVVIEGDNVSAALEATPGLPLAHQPCEFTVRYVRANGVEALIKTILCKLNDRTVALTARVLRRMVQTAPWSLALGRRVVNNSLTDLLSFIRQGEALANTSDFYAVSLVELSLALSLIFAQSPASREATRQLLIGDLALMAATRSAILNYLDRASDEYFQDIRIIDAHSGRQLNTLDGVQWDPAGWPTKEAIHLALSGAASTSPIPLSTLYAADDVQKIRLSRLTQVLLRYSVHLALSNEEQQGDGATARVYGAGAAREPEVRQVRGRSRSGSSSADSSRSASVPLPPREWKSGAQGGRAGDPPTGRHATDPAVVRRQQQQQQQQQHHHQQQQQQHAQPSRHRATSNSAPAHRRASDGRPTAPQRTRSQSQQLPPGALRRPSLGFTRALRGRQSPQEVEPYPPREFHAHDAALKLAIQYSRHFSSSVSNLKKAGPPRWTPPSSSNPWKPPTKKWPEGNLWTVADLKAGDLFMFSIPHDHITVAAVERVLFAAQKHVTSVKKAFLTTPQRAKSRRWALFDLLNMVMPHCQDLLIRLAKLVERIGKADVHVPLFMLRQQEIQDGETDINPGNLGDVVDQLLYYATVHRPGGTDAEVAETVAKMRAFAAQDPQGFADFSSGSSSE